MTEYITLEKGQLAKQLTLNQVKKRIYYNCVIWVQTI
ncbi:hypothetical protein Cpin_4399 [Chitinophaga pinensis DSM 2588]|uniref:Uncharacterized protein n=1 Tax=Chitinophaga pinensis (strain ATCC 43595 / DSM 2588 / LMG 13176 / NBRC 15968 / NCIMB 11800 / UQM 2034) TaxID=485918 RepID=A0A979G6N7_CHIPD|nr:hypothetical protein Cpin_4399 [Chitinophaga pinensis DSM 2588]